MAKKINTKKRVADTDRILTPAEAKKVRHGMKHLRQGRAKLWLDAKHGVKG